MTPPRIIRAVELGGPKPLFCVPLVAADSDQLIDQASVARGLGSDLVEWRADAYERVDAEAFVEAAYHLRSVLGDTPIIYTLRRASEGGARLIDQDLRVRCMSAVLRTGVVDVIDVELSNGPEFVSPLVDLAHTNSTAVILSLHDFEKTLTEAELMQSIALMVENGADIAKLACMPRRREDVLTLFQVTLAARQAFPRVPLCTISMGNLGAISRVAGFLYGSDMTFAVGQQVSAPGQIPLAEARTIADALLKYS
ncbi:MAG: type I 3-dehydroquinate dehydratase [Acidobacteriota bacterium]